MARIPRTADRIRVQQAVRAAQRRTARATAPLYLDAFRSAARAPSDGELERAVEAGPNQAARVLLPEGTTREAGETMLRMGAGEGADVERRMRRQSGDGALARAEKPEVTRKPVPVRAAEWARARAAALVTEIEDPAREAIRAIVTRSLSAGLHVRETAKRLRPIVGIHPRNVAPIERLREKMVKRGMPEAKIEDAVERAVKRAVAARADAIARTETASAVNQGRAGFYDELAREGQIDARKIVRTWLTARDERVDDICEDLDGETAKGIDGEFPGGYGTPPAHVSCRCVELWSES